MKRIKRLLYLALAIGVIMVGCGKKAEENVEVENSTETATEMSIENV